MFRTYFTKMFTLSTYTRNVENSSMSSWNVKWEVVCHFVVHPIRTRSLESTLIGVCQYVHKKRMAKVHIVWVGE